MASLNQHDLSLGRFAQCEVRGAKTKEFLLAAKTGDCEKLEHLINDGCHIHAVKSNGSNALMLASKNGHLQIIQLLIKSGIDVNVKNNKGWDALMIASKYGRDESVEHLIQCGCDVNAVKNDGCNALMLAAERGLERTADILIQNKTELHTVNIEGWNALMFAANNGHTRTVELLINNGADVNTLNTSGNNALLLASKNGHREVVELLILSGADATTINSNGSNALMLASKNGHDDTVEVLVQCGIDVNVVKNNGWNALMLASNYGHAATVQLLIQCGGDFNAVDADRCNALMLAAKSGHIATVQMLVKSGADINAVNNQGYTAEKLASILKYENIIKVLKTYPSPSSTDLSVEASNVRQTNPVGRMVHAVNCQQNIPNASCEGDILSQLSVQYADLSFNTNEDNSVGAEETEFKQTLASDRSLTPTVAGNLAPGPGNRRPKCLRCGTCHLARSCPAYGQTCENCGKMNHLTSVCKATLATARASRVEVTVQRSGSVSAIARGNTTEQPLLAIARGNTTEQPLLAIARGNTTEQPLLRSQSATCIRSTVCYCCGTSHQRGQCLASGQTCSKCGKVNHFTALCKSSAKTSAPQTPEGSITSSASLDQDKPIHGKLQDHHYSLLRSKYTFLVENIDSKSIVNHLFSKNILDFNDKQLVTGKATPRERTEALLDIILNAGPKRAFPEFINALKEDYPHIAEILSELV